MSRQCPACNQPLTVDGALPKFCSNCGAPLSESGNQNDLVQATAEPDPTIAANLDADKTEQVEETDIRPMTAGLSDEIETIAPGTNPNVSKNSIEAAEEGSVIGPFEVIRKLGQGGMGSVFEARHSKTGQRVALKLLTRSLRTTEETIQRFQRESHIAASINHPRSTFVYQAGQHQGQFYITMELMPGGTLNDIVKEDGGIPIERAVDYVLDIISGLQAAHEAGIVHRDLKPSNCFIDEKNRVKIGDFGLAKSFMADSSLTQTGTFMGTPQFAAPEQLRASEVDERTDIYAIGGTLFYLIAGRAPFTGNAAQVIASIASETPPKLDIVVSDVPRELSSIIHQTLEKDPERRPLNLEELRQALLPYSSRGAAPVELGRRIAAFFIDATVVMMIAMFFGQLFGVFAPYLNASFRTINLISMSITFGIAILYFATLEHRFGKTVGKWLLRIRVINQQNQPPTFAQALLRASITPGLAYLSAMVITYLMNFNPTQMNSEKDVRALLEYQILSFTNWIPCLLCFVSAREENGFLAFHDKISGTRVVRLAGALEAKRPRKVPTTLAIVNPNEEAMMVGDFRVQGLLGKDANQNPVRLGRDPALNRSVWIFEQDAVGELRKSVARPTRLRILSELEFDGKHYCVTESVRGMCFFDYVRDADALEWSSFRPLLREIVYELAQGLEDGTLPTRLNGKSVWVDQSGRSKFLDVPFSSLSEETSGEKKLTLSKDLSPIEFLQELYDRFIEYRVAPVHVLELQHEISTYENTPESLRELGKRLGVLGNVPSEWKWDDRLGLLAVTSSLESTFGATLAWVLTVGAAYYLEFSLVATAIAVGGTLVALALILGAVFHGGPVFRFTGVTLLKNKTLSTASRARAAIRNLFAWLPMIAVATLFAILMHQVFEMMAQKINDPTESVALLVALLGLTPALLLAVAGAFYSVLRPARGVQDWLAGTRLVRK